MYTCIFSLLKYPTEFTSSCNHVHLLHVIGIRTAIPQISVVEKVPDAAATGKFIRVNRSNNSKLLFLGSIFGRYVTHHIRLKDQLSGTKMVGLLHSYLSKQFGRTVCEFLREDLSREQRCAKSFVRHQSRWRLEKPIENKAFFFIVQFY